MKPLSESKNIKIGVILSYVVMGVSIIGSLFISNRVLNLIGDYNFGLYSFVNSITSWLTVVSAALTSSFLKFTTSEAKENNGDVRKTNTIYFKILALLGSSVLLFGFGFLALLYFGRVNIGPYDWDDSQLMYMLFALSIFNIGLTMPVTIFALYINYKKKFVFGKLLNIFTLILNYAGHFIIAYFTKNIVLIAAFTIVITLITFAFNAIYCFKHLGMGFKKTALSENKTLILSIAAFSGILLLNTIVDEINSSVDKTLLGFFSIPEDVTKYQMAQQFAIYLTTMSVAVSSVFAPSIYELVTNNEKEPLNNLYIKISKVQSVVLCCVAFGFLTCGKDFVLWWIGEKRITSYYVAAILMILGLGPLTMNASIEIQRAMNKHKFRAIVYFVFALLNVGLSVLFLFIFDREYAIYACLTGTIITRIGSHWIMMNIYNKKEIKLPIGRYLFNLFTYIFVGTGSFFIVFVVNKLFVSNISSHLLKFLIQGSLFVLIYLSVCFILNRKIVLRYICAKLSKNKTQDIA